MFPSFLQIHFSPSLLTRVAYHLNDAKCVFCFTVKHKVSIVWDSFHSSKLKTRYVDYEISPGLKFVRWKGSK